VVIHFIQSRQALERRDRIRNVARRSNPQAVGVHPQTDQQLGIERRPPAFFLAAPDGAITAAFLFCRTEI
jgi:hypothetical protein